ncbi:MAG TPA: ATP-dependent helicase, partial [Methylomirabilota bacterium]|nr:ATP-dependent helicase [Methylomirabilota bacterium]
MPEAVRGGERILEGLNEAQAAAVTHEAGPLLIIAGAGTGKTTVITRRIAYLIATRRARPSEILALTFTDKAAAEMEERVDTLVPYGYADVQISTFHAFGDRLIKENALELGITPDADVLTRAEQVVFLRDPDRLFKLPLDHYRPLGDPTRLLQAITNLFSRLKDEDVGPDEYLAHAQELLAKANDEVARLEAEHHIELARTYSQYQMLMVQERKLDFGDQIVESLRLLRTRPHVLRRYQQRFKHILVDEFQDTNYAQFELVKLLAAKHRNVAVVGDDDQAIFRFRGASMSNILDFDRTYADARKVILKENHRSPQAILNTAYRLIQYNNPDRLEVAQNVDKRLIARGPEVRLGKPPEHLAFDTVSSESDWVAGRIAEEHAVGRPYKDCAILVRANNDADPFLRALNMRGIPWTFSGNAGLYGRPEIRLLIAFLRAVAHPDDSVSLYYLASSDIYQVPIFDLSNCATYADRKNRWLVNVLRDPPDELGVTAEGAAAIRRLTTDLERYMELAREHPTGELLYRFLVDSGLMTRYAKAPAELEQETQNVSKFFNQVKDTSHVLKYDNVREFVKHLELLIEADDDPPVAEADVDTPAVHVLTVHKAKGLEWPVVFLVNCVQEKFPTRRRSEALEMPLGLIKDTLPTGDFHLQEERRLFYVGLTRAKEAVYLTGAEDMGGKRKWKVSQFVLEALDLPKDETRP